MAPRIKILRKVLSPPTIKGFKPFGGKIDNSKSLVVELHFEEYEALRLCDYDMCNHNNASKIMNVSRPTFTRIYASARKKIAKAFVEGSQIVIEGGKVYFDSEWYHCKICKCNFNNPDKHIEVDKCPLCKGNNFENYEDLKSDFEDDKNSCIDFCKCPSCGLKQPHKRGVKCNSELCPDCKIPMIRNKIDRCRE